MAKKIKLDVVSKLEAVRRALAAGHKSPRTGCQYIKDTFGFEMGWPMYYSYTTNLRKKGLYPSTESAAKDSVKLQKAMEDRIGGKVILSPIVSELGLAKDVKKLVDQYGADAVKEMAELFAG